MARAECPSERGERFKRLGLSKETLTALVSRGFAATASIASSLGCSTQLSFRDSHLVLFFRLWLTLAKTSWEPEVGMRLQGGRRRWERRAGLVKGVGTEKHLFPDSSSFHHVRFQKYTHFLLIFLRKEDQV